MNTLRLDLPLAGLPSPAELTDSFADECVFHAHSATHSTGIRPLIPR
ncbi:MULTISPECIES: hypothetical protein [unclassified Thiocapsa]